MSNVSYKKLDSIGYPKYRIGDDGSVWSFRVNRWKKMKPHLVSGYPHVYLYHKGSRVRFSVHFLVLTSFVGVCPESMEACHANGDRTDANLSNLRWDTHKGNALDMIKHGRSMRGERQLNSKLTKDAVIAIREEYSKGGVSFDKLGEKYGVNKTLIFRVVKGKSWSHV